MSQKILPESVDELALLHARWIGEKHPQIARQYLNALEGGANSADYTAVQERLRRQEYDWLPAIGNKPHQFSLYAEGERLDNGVALQGHWITVIGNVFTYYHEGRLGHGNEVDYWIQTGLRNGSESVEQRTAIMVHTRAKLGRRNDDIVGYALEPSQIMALLAPRSLPAVLAEGLAAVTENLCRHQY